MIEIYTDRMGKTRWRAKAENHKLVAESAGGYNDEDQALHHLAVLINMLLRGVVVKPSPDPVAFSEMKNFKIEEFLNEYL